jgi:hypothetical protein
MSQENVEVVRRAFEGAGTRGLQETAQAYWHPEVEYVEDPRWPGASTYNGRDAVLRCFQAYMEALGREEDLEVTVEACLRRRRPPGALRPGPGQRLRKRRAA